MISGALVSRSLLDVRVRLIMSKRTNLTITEEMDDEAMSHFFALMDAKQQGNVADVLSKANAWLRQCPAHRIAWARAQRTGRLLGPFLEATEPGASDEEIRAFFDAITEERHRAPEEFGDA